jgi:hypothetical protein
MKVVYNGFPSRRVSRCADLWCRAEAYRYSRNARVERSSLSSMDSDLEAFSHNPTHDSFAALPVQATAITNYVNQRFLSY